MGQKVNPVGFRLPVNHAWRSKWFAPKKSFGSFEAVKGISFSVAKGEVLGFLGPNGAGKSTTMRMITGFLPPTSGTAVVCGHDIAADPVAAKQCIGYLPESAPSYRAMTVTEWRATRKTRIRGRSWSRSANTRTSTEWPRCWTRWR